MLNKLIAVLLSTLIYACNLPGTKRGPASEYQVTDEPIVFFQLKLKTLEKGLFEIAQNSPIIEKIHRFEMDPVTRILNINMTIDYPLESLFDFTELPKDKQNRKHEIEIALSLPETKTLAYTRYMGLQFHKFKIDGDNYINAFEVVAAVTKTILANSELIHYLENKSQESIQDENKQRLLKEIIDSNGIVVFHTSKKINFKLDLSQFAELNRYTEDYSNLRLWRFSPTLFQGKEVRFKIIAGEGKPSQSWMQSQQQRIAEDTRTLLQVREDLYQEYSDTENVSIIINEYLGDLLSNEQVKITKLAPNYQNEIKELLTELSQKAQSTLTRDNENFSADPEYEYLEFIEHAKSQLRLFVSDLDRRLSIDSNILAGGLIKTNKKPLLTKLVSQNLLNGGMNFLTDLEFENTQILSKANLWLKPELPGVTLQGKINLPLEKILGKMDDSLIGVKIDSKMIESSEGIPFSLTLEQNMSDKGILGLDIKNFTMFKGSKQLSFNRRSKNQQFLIDLTKIFLAQSLGEVEIELDDEIDEQQRQADEIKEILTYIKEFQDLFEQGSEENQLARIFISDLQLNPFIMAGENHVRNKKKILFGDLIRFNEKNKLFELKVDPSAVVDKINNTEHNLQVWGVSPIYSKELDNTFLKLDIGQGIRSKSFIDQEYYSKGLAENSEFSGLYYELAKHRNPVDLLFTLNFDYLESYINLFLSDMVKSNQINIVSQAKNNPGETFYEIGHLNLEVTPNKEFKLNMSIKMAEYTRNWLKPWTKKLKEDSYTLSMLLDLKSKNIRSPKNLNLTNLQYYNQAISINPKQIKIKAGKPSFINKAITGIINSTVRLSLNNGTMKKLLMKLTNKFLTKTYTSNNQKVLGHEIEKIARLYTTKDDLLIFLNPRLSGAAFDLHLTGNHKDIFQAIKLDNKNQTLSVALSASVSMAKIDKRNLINIFKEATTLLAPYKKASSKEQLQKLLADGQLVGKLLTNTDAMKMGLYKKMIQILKKYDQVLHQVNIPHAESKIMEQRISATGSELIYFASVAFYMHEQLEMLIAKMERYGLTSINDSYPTFKEGSLKLKKNISEPLLEVYRSQRHQSNQVIINNKISYWTYLFFPDAYFAESAYKIIKTQKALKGM